MVITIIICVGRWRNLSMIKKTHLRYFSIIVATIFLILSLSSCSNVSNVIQVFDVASSSCNTDSDCLYYENDTLRIVYMFWGEGGTMGIYIHNKSELPLYIDWKKCSFIVGEFKNDYWSEEIISSSNTTTTTIGLAQQKGSASASYWFENFVPQIVSGNSSQSGSSNSNWHQQTFHSFVSRITKPERITFIPPHATICQSAYNLMTTQINIDPIAILSDMTVRVMDRDDRPATVNIKLRSVDFNTKNTPLNFRSYLTYSYDEQFRTEAYIDNSFYISKVIQLSRRAFKAQPVVVPSGYSKENMWSSPTRFYITPEE
jgi:hypothetical protein